MPMTTRTHTSGPLVLRAITALARWQAPPVPDLAAAAAQLVAVLESQLAPMQVGLALEGADGWQRFGVAAEHAPLPTDAGRNGVGWQRAAITVATSAGLLLLKPAGRAINADLLAALAAQVEQALTSTPLTGESIPRTEASSQADATLQLDVLGRTNGRPLDLSIVLSQIVEQVTYLLDADRVSIQLLVDQPNQIEAVAIYDRALARTSRNITRYTISDFDVVGQVLSSGEAFISDDVLNDPRVVTSRATFESYDYRGMMMLPLSAGSQRIGILGVTTVGRPNHWPSSAVKLAYVLANQAATAIQNARLLAQVDRQRRELTLLQETSATLYRGLSLDETLRTILDGVARLVTYDSAEISLYDPTRHVLVGRIDRGRRPDSGDLRVYAPGNSLAGGLLQTRQTANIPDLAETTIQLPSGIEMPIRSYLGVPLLVGAEIVGTLELGASEPYAFSHEDQQLVELIADQAAQAIVNTQRYESTTNVLNERIVQFSALQRITVELNSTLDVNIVLKLVLDEAIRVLQADRGCVALSQDQGQSFAVVVAAGYQPAAEQALLAYAPGTDQTTMSRVARGSEPIITLQNLRDITSQDGSGVDVPIIYQERGVGVLSLRASRAQAFTEEQLPFLRLLSDQAALALGSAAYYSEQLRQRELAQQRANLLDEVFEIGNNQRTDRPLTDTLTDIAYGIVNAVGFRAVLFALRAPGSAVFAAVASAGLLPDQAEYLQQHPMQVEFVERLIDPDYQISQSFYLPTTVVNAALAQQPSDPTVNTITEQRTSDEWQADEMLITPLYSSDQQLLGIVSVDDPFDRRRPNRRTVEALEIFANQAKVAIENSQLYTATQRQLAEQNALSQLSQDISGLLDVRVIIDKVFQTLQNILTFDSFYSLAYYQGSDDRRLIVAYDQGNWEEEKNVQRELGKGLHRHMIEQRQPLFFNDLPAEGGRLPDGYAPLTFGQDTRRSRSWMGVPLIASNQQVIGAISIHSYTSHAFQERDLTFFQALARQVVLTLQNARLFEERERRLQETSILNQLAAAISTPMGLKQLATVLHEHVSRALRADAFFLAVYDPENDLLEFPLSVEHGQDSPIPTRRGLSGMTGFLMNMQTPLLLTANVADELAQRGIVGVGDPPRSLLAVPLIANGRSIGVISIQDFVEADAYSQHDLQLLQAFATQTASGIEKARLLAERERQVAEFKALSDIGKVTSSTLDVQEMFQGIYQEVARYRPLDAFLLLTFDLAGYQITRTMIMEDGQQEFSDLARPIRPNSYTDRLVTSRQPLLIRNAGENRGATVPMSVGPIDRETLSWAGVLLLNTVGEPFGVLSMQSYQADAFDERDIIFLTNVAGQVALNIQNAGLFVQSQAQIEQLRALDAIASVTSSTLDFQTMLMGVYEVIKTYRNSDVFVFNIYDQATDQIIQALEIDRDEIHRVVRPEAVSADSLTGWVLRHKQPVLIHDFTAPDALVNYPELQPMHVPNPDAPDPERSLVSVPLLDTRGNSLGMLSLQDGRPNQFTQRDVEFLTNVANQVALNVQNARLFEQTREQVEQLRILREMGQASTTLSIGQMLRLLYAQMNAVRPLDTLLLVVYDQKTKIILQRVIIDRENYQETGSVPLPPNSLTSWVIEHQQPLLFSDFKHELAHYPEITPVFTSREHMPQSWLAVPLRAADGAPLGLISMQQYAPSYFGADDINFLTNVASQIGLNIENAALFQKTQAQVQLLEEEAQRMRLLNRVSSAASATLDLDALLKIAVDEMATVAGADQARLVLFDRPRGVGVVAAEHVPTGAVGAMTVPLIDNPSIIWMDKHHTALLVEDIQSNAEFSSLNELFQQLGIQTVMFVPLVVKNEVIGSIGLDKYERRGFNVRSMEMCQTIANQVATAIENARLLDATQESVRELTTLYDISVNLNTTLDTGEILEIMANAATDILRTDYGAVLLVNRQGEITRFSAFGKDGEQIEQMPLRDNASFRHMLATGQPMVLHDLLAAADPNLDFLERGLRSGLAVPIMVAGQAVGSVMVGGTMPRRWSDKDQSLLTILASQAATTIENARLFESEQAKRRLADAMRGVSQAFTTALALEEIYSLLLDKVSEIVHYDSALLLAPNPDTDGASFVVLDSRGFGAASDELHSLSFDRADHSVLRQIISTREPVVVDDTAGGEAFIAGYTELMRSWTAVPLILSNNDIVVYVLGSQQPDSFAAEQIQTVATIANQAATAMNTARLIEEIRGLNVELEQKVLARTSELTAEKDRLEAVHAITLTLTASLDSDEIALKSLELAASAVGVGRGMVLRSDVMQETLVCKAILSQEQGLQTVDQVVDLPDGGLAGWVLAHQKSVMIADTARDPRWVQVDNFTANVRSVVAVPLAAADVQLGVLMLIDARPNTFTEEHLRLLGTIANEVAIAMNNAELYDLINDQAARLAETLQLQRQEASQNRAILESVAEGVLVIDDHDAIALYNRAAAEVLRVPAGAIFGRSLDHIAQFGQTTDDHQRGLLIYAGLVDGIRLTYKDTEPQNLTLELPGQTIAATFAPVLTTDGTRMGTAAVLRDITREIEADKSKRAFISTISHELRTPLTSIKGYVDLLLINTAGEINEMQRTFLVTVKNNADRLNALVADLLEISRLENGNVALNFSLFNIQDMIKEQLPCYSPRRSASG